MTDALKYDTKDKDDAAVWTVQNRLYPHQAPPTARIAKFKAYDHDGGPLAGGKVHTYETGTSTEYTTFSDPGLTSPNANPVILDSNGEADIYCADGYHPKLVLKDSNDVLYWTIDYYYEQAFVYLDEQYPDDESLSTANKMSFFGGGAGPGPYYTRTYGGLTQAFFDDYGMDSYVFSVWVDPPPWGSSHYHALRVIGQTINDETTWVQWPIVRSYGGPEVDDGILASDSKVMAGRVEYGRFSAFETGQAFAEFDLSAGQTLTSVFLSITMYGGSPSAITLGGDWTGGETTAGDPNKQGGYWLTNQQNTEDGSYGYAFNSVVSYYEGDNEALKSKYDHNPVTTLGEFATPLIEVGDIFCIDVTGVYNAAVNAGWAALGFRIAGVWDVNDMFYEGLNYYDLNAGTTIHNIRLVAVSNATIDPWVFLSKPGASGGLSFSGALTVVGP